jgi:hypothetical protein
MSKIKDEKIKETVYAILAEREKYPREISFALHFCEEALELSGESLREKCKYILGNLIFWKSPRSVKIKIKLRKFAFKKDLA